jgi:HK97 family phage major capsid protein
LRIGQHCPHDRGKRIVRIEVNVNNLLPWDSQQPPDDARRTVALMLAQHYGELAGTAAKPLPKFSLARALDEMTTEKGLHSGYEHEICSSAALIAGGKHDPHRCLFPWAALATRDATVAGTGGYLTAVQNLAAADVLRPWSVVARAGLTILDNLKGSTTIPKVGTAPTGQWLASEGTSVTVSDPILGQVALTPRIYGAMIQFSHKFLLQAPTAEVFVRAQLLRAAAKALDAAVLAGTGTEQPTGILGMAGLASESGTAFAWANATNILQTLADAGLDDANVSFVAAPNARKVLQGRAVSTSGPRFIWDSDRVVNRSAYATSSMSSTLMLAGDFSRAVLGLFGPGVELAVNPNDPTFFKSGIVQTRVLMVADVAAPQLGAFVKTTAIT